MSRKKQKWMQCAASCSDNSRCTRSAKFEDRLCHIHLAQQQRAAGTAPPDPTQFVSAERTPLEELTKIAKDPKNPGQMQALKILLDRQGCPGCLAREEQQATTDDLWERMTLEQGDALRALLAQINAMWTALKPIVVTQPRRALLNADGTAIPPPRVLRRWAEEDAAAQAPAPIAADDVAEEEEEELDEEEEDDFEEIDIVDADDKVIETIRVPKKETHD